MILIIDSCSPLCRRNPEYLWCGSRNRRRMECPSLNRLCRTRPSWSRCAPLFVASVPLGMGRVGTKTALCLATLRGLNELTAMPFEATPEAAAVQDAILRRMTNAQRPRLSLEMSEFLRNVALAGLRNRRPELYTEERLRELLRIMYGFVRRQLIS